MSLSTNYSDIVGAIESARLAWNSYPLQVEYPNRERIDLATQINPYLMVDIVYNSSLQMDLGPQPLISDYGQIHIAAGVKIGSGTLILAKLLNHVRGYLEMKLLLGVGVRTQAATLTLDRTANGFYYQPMFIPFWEVHVLP